MQRKVGLLFSVFLFLCITPSQWTPCTKLLAESQVAVFSVISMRLDSATTSRGCFNAQLHLISFPQSPQFFSPALDYICNSLMLTVLHGPSYFPPCKFFFLCGTENLATYTLVTPPAQALSEVGNLVSSNSKSHLNFTIKQSTPWSK